MELPIKVAGKSLKVNIETRGDKGPALLMVHGIPTNARLWRKVQGHSWKIGTGHSRWT